MGLPFQETKLVEGRELLRNYVNSFVLYKRHVTFLDGIFSYVNRYVFLRDRHSIIIVADSLVIFVFVFEELG